jgi:hypothetical protein
MFCRSLRSFNTSSVFLARRSLKATLPSNINPESVADDILDSLFDENSQVIRAPAKKEPVIIEDVKLSSSNDTPTRGRRNRRITPQIKIDPPSISTRLALLQSSNPIPNEPTQPEKTWTQDLDAYVPPPTSTEKDMSWFGKFLSTFIQSVTSKISKRRPLLRNSSPVGKRSLMITRKRLLHLRVRQSRSRSLLIPQKRCETG